MNIKNRDIHSRAFKNVPFSSNVATPYFFHLNLHKIIETIEDNLLRLESIFYSVPNRKKHDCRNYHYLSLMRTKLYTVRHGRFV